MKVRIGMFVMFCLAGLASLGHATDRTGQLGLNYTVGPNFIVGDSEARDNGSVQPGVGAALQYGITSQIDATFGYDYMDADLRTQALTFGGNYRLAPGKPWAPFVGGGLGFGKPFSGEGWGHFSMKLTGGVERELTEEFSLAGLISYQYVDGTDPIGSIHAIEPGLRLIYYFGSIHYKKGV